jgi:hypothetical protein
MIGVGGLLGCGQSACLARLTCHLGILRLIRRGLDRSRRFGFSRWQMGTSAWAQPRSLLRGGKTARL